MIELLLEAERALSYGLPDRAEQLYRQVAGADPKNSIAVVGLARVALERADDLGAYLLARRALAIDPENEAARRLALRLEEVLATRGEPVADPMPAALAAGPPLGSPAPRPDASAYEPPRANGPQARGSRAPSTPPRPPGAPVRRRSILDRFRRR